jgi:hypothetical protein
MHTDPTLELLSQATTSLGNSIREFEQKTCTLFQTRELNRELDARRRRQEKKSMAEREAGPKPKTPPKTITRKPKHLNLRTYTYHSLGDYARTIELYGTTDSFSTQPVSFQQTSYPTLLTMGGHQSELEHRRSKARLPWTSGRSIPLQLSKIERRQRRICTIREQLHSRSRMDLEDVVNDPQAQYNIGKTQNLPIHVPTLLQKNNDDPATKVGSPIPITNCTLMPMLQNFLTKLKKHLLPRIREVLHEEAACHPEHPGLRAATSNFRTPSTPDGDALQFIFLKKDRIYHHRLSRFHFTTYDVRRGTDVINPGTPRCNVMLLNDSLGTMHNLSNTHRFLYACVLGVYHANVIYTGPGMRDYEARRLEFLWVRWYEVVDPASSGWNHSRLDSIRFRPMNEEDAFGFVDPRDVLRGCHIMPNFANGKRHADGVGISRYARDGKDYKSYYVGR